MKRNFNITLSPYLIKNQFNILFLFKFFFLLFFVSSCSIEKSNPYKLSQEEYEALNEFFKEFLFQDGGAYTLYGDKPISFHAISNFPDPEEKKPIEIKTSWLNGWKKVSHRFKTPLFLLVERPSPFSKEAKAVFFVNIEATASMLKTRYSEFRNLVGYEFDPLSIVFDIEDLQSFFWNKVISDDYFLGVILGYGDINAWLYKCCTENYKNGCYKGKNETKINAFLGKIFNRTPDSQNFEKTKEDLLFSLPPFGCLSMNQTVLLIEKYIKNREQIRKIYKGKDFVTVTLDRLTSKDLPQEPNERYLNLLRKTSKNIEIMPKYFDPSLPSDEN